MGSEKRRATKRIMVRTTPEEFSLIEALAATCDLSVPALMRQTALGYTPKSTIDAQHRLNIAKLQGDIGRIGGLLKIWLSSDIKEKEFSNLEISEIMKELKHSRDLINREYDLLSN